jgi:hypothetical protein
MLMCRANQCMGPSPVSLSIPETVGPWFSYCLIFSDKSFTRMLAFKCRVIFMLRSSDVIFMLMSSS